MSCVKQISTIFGKLNDILCYHKRLELILIFKSKSMSCCFICKSCAQQLIEKTYLVSIVEVATEFFLFENYKTNIFPKN